MAERTQNDAPKGRKPPLWRKAFLASLSQTGCITAAARAAGVERKTAYRCRSRNAEFASQWDSALETFADAIEAEAIRRAVKGVTRYKFYKGKPILHPALCLCDHDRAGHENDARCRAEGCSCARFSGQPYKEQEHSDTLLMFLLRGLQPEKYRDNLGLSQEEIDAILEKRIAELVEARASQIGRNGTIHPPGPAPQGSPPSDSSSTGAAAGGPILGQGSLDPSTFYSDAPPLLPDGFPERGPANGP
jgi:hypothetical protein